jgi:type VI secretion system protein ImpK
MSPPAHPPSLFGSSPPSLQQPSSATHLLDLMYDGFYLLFLLRGKHAPLNADVFRDRIKQFLTQFERGASKLGASPDDIFGCKYAFCATVDEAVLMSSFKIKESWQRLPLQVQFFGDQLAGEQFFLKLDELRHQGQPRQQVLEVYQMCLLLGFQGKYLIEGSEKLGYLTVRLGDEIARMRGQSPGFAPHWEAPDRVSNQLKHHAPLWAIASLFGLMASLAFIGLRWQLSEHTQARLDVHHHIVQLAPQSAHITITLP